MNREQQANNNNSNSKDQERKALESLILKNKYQLNFFSKSGGFGEVFIAKHITKDYDVAVKFVINKILVLIFIYYQSSKRLAENTRQFNNEIQVLKIIKKLQNSKGNVLVSKHLVGFPRLLTCGTLDDKQLNYMVITKFDSDLELIFSQMKRTFKMQTILTIGMQMIDLLEKLHSLGFIHNDLKPQNIMVKWNQNQVYLIDFGLTSNINEARKYKFRGTPYYASNGSILKQGNGPKDDLESLIYILLYFCYGNLPWQRDIPVLQEDVMSNMQIQNVVNMRNPYTLCNNVDIEFAQILDYLQNLNYKKKPNYKLLRSYFDSMITRNNIKLTLEWSDINGPPVMMPHENSVSLTKQMKEKFRSQKDNKGSFSSSKQEEIQEVKSDQNFLQARKNNNRHMKSQSVQKDSKFKVQKISGQKLSVPKLQESFVASSEKCDLHDGGDEDQRNSWGNRNFEYYSINCKESLHLKSKQFKELKNLESYHHCDLHLEEDSKVNEIYYNRPNQNDIKIQGKSSTVRF